VKLIRSSADHLLFQLGKRERQLLLAILKLYPCIPSAHQSLSKAGTVPEPEASQRLLDEALADQQRENRRHLETLLADPHRFSESTEGWRLALSPADLEWLLQILNDIRVGSWILLGSPDDRLKSLNPETAPHFWAMEMSGHFQMQLLQALQP
jgi:hypothetical protein